MAYIDRTAMSLAFLRDDFKDHYELSKSDYGLASGIFYSTYITLKLPSTILMSRTKRPHLFLACSCVGSGIVSAVIAVMPNLTGFIICRLLQGLLQAVMVPGTWYYVAMLVPPAYITITLVVVEAGILTAQSLNAPIAWATFQLGGLLSFEAWQWLFITAGVFTVLLGIIMAVVLPPNVTSITWLNPAEAQTLQECLTSTQTEIYIPQPGFKHAFKSLMRNLNLQTLTLAMILRNCVLFSFSTYFVPSMLQDSLDESTLGLSK